MPRLSQPRQRVVAPAQEDNLEADHEATIALSQTEEVRQDQPQDSPEALKAQIESLRKSEQEAVARADAEYKRAEQALKQANDRDGELAKLQEQTITSQQEAILAALAAANAEAEAATREIDVAAGLGDTRAQADAYRKLARAESRILGLENGKEAIERQIEEVKKAPKIEPRVETNAPLTQEQQIDNLRMPLTAKNWLKQHPQYVFDPKQNKRIQAVHYQLEYEGLTPYSPEYFEEVEYRLGHKQRPGEPEEIDDMEDEVPAPKRMTVSAPPSREVPSSSGSRSDGRITLTKAQKEAAKIAGVEEAEYAKQLIRLKQEKALGNYGGG